MMGLLYFGSLIMFGAKFDFWNRVKEESNLLPLIGIVLDHGCQLSNFLAAPPFRLAHTIFLVLERHMRPLDIGYLPQLYSLLQQYACAPLAAQVARLLYEAWAPLNRLCPLRNSSRPIGAIRVPSVELICEQLLTVRSARCYYIRHLSSQKSSWLPGCSTRRRTRVRYSSAPSRPSNARSTSTSRANWRYSAPQCLLPFPMPFAKMSSSYALLEAALIVPSRSLIISARELFKNSLISL